MPTDLAGQRVTVMGLGRFGGGVGVTRFLVEQGCEVLVTDTASEDELSKSVDQLADLPGISFRLGGHELGDFTDADLIVANPAVKPGNPHLKAAREHGVPVTSEIRLLVERLPSPQRVIGVTGSAGKSTTTAMIGHLLNRAGLAAHLGGNLGGSLLPELNAIGTDDWVVLELSSFMLDGLREDRWSPHVAVVTNLGPNHLDWHGTFEAYAQAKRVIVEFQGPDDLSVLTRDAAAALGVKNASVMVEAAGPAPELRVPGSHNAMNARVAAAVGQLAGVEQADLSDFAGLPHRLQFVGEVAGVSCYNDSKCTTPDAATLALQAFEPGRCHVILGGYDKGSDLTGLAQYAAEHARAVYTIGATGDAVAEACGSGSAVTRCGELDHAVRQALAQAVPGDVLLLSPGCASWDQFTHFEERGEAFVEAVKRHAAKPCR